MITFKSIVQIANIFLFFLCAMGYISYDNIYDNNLVSILIIVAIVVSLLNIIVKCKGRLFSPIVLFVISYLISYYQIYADLIFSNVYIDNTFFFINTNVINKSIILCTCGLLALFIGFNKSYHVNENALDENKGIYTLTPLIYINFILLLLFIATADMSYFMGGYGSVDMSGVSFYIEILLRISFLAIFILHSRNYIGKKILKTTSDYLKSYHWLFYISITIYFLLVMFSGDRGPIIYTGIVFVFSYYLVLEKKIKPYTIMFYLVIGATVMTLLGSVRSQKQGSFSEKLIYSLNSEDESRYSNSIIPQTAELASTIKTVHYATTYVPTVYGHTNGVFQLKYMLGAIPFSSPMQSLFIDTEKKFIGSSSFITWLIQGDFPTYGNGTSVIADFYLDFGFIGVVFGMFLLGLLFSRVDFFLYDTHYRYSYFMYSVSFTLLSLAIYLPRSTVMGHIKNVLWLYLLLIIYTKIIKPKLDEKLQ